MKQKNNLGHYGVTIKLKENDREKFITQFKSVDNVVRTYGTDLKILNYEPTDYKFREIIGRHLNKNFDLNIDPLNLGRLHCYVGENYKTLDDSEINQVSKSFYELGSEFSKEYERFMNVEIGKYLKDEYYIQRTPTIRCHMPDQKGFDWRPRIHTDIMLGHPPSEVNVWVPFTKAFGTNSMIIAPLRESMDILTEINFDFEKLALLSQTSDEFCAKISKIMAPVELEYGQYLIFDPRCLHATQFNNTDSTRISMDVRYIAKVDEMNDELEYRGTGRLKMPFKSGHYYSDKVYHA